MNCNKKYCFSCNFIYVVKPKKVLSLKAYTERVTGVKQRVVKSWFIIYDLWSWFMISRQGKPKKWSIWCKIRMMKQNIQEW